MCIIQSKIIEHIVRACFSLHLPYGIRSENKTRMNTCVTLVSALMLAVNRVR